MDTEPCAMLSLQATVRNIEFKNTLSVLKLSVSASGRHVGEDAALFIIVLKWSDDVQPSRFADVLNVTVCDQPRTLSKYKPHTHTHAV